jgi:hypothetical protein
VLSRRPPSLDIVRRSLDVLSGMVRHDVVVEAGLFRG